MSGKKVWKKILYENQGYPDNYTDKNIFLRDLKKNIDFKEVTFIEAVKGANLLVQQFCSIVGFVIIYYYLVNDWVEPSTVLNYSSTLTVIGFLLHLSKHVGNIKKKLGNYVRTLLTYFVFGHLFSPVLYTLTDTVSTDTIYTMTFFMMVIHLIFFDYGVNAAIISSSLSLSAAVFASICLASRLSSPYHAFILMTTAMEAFVLFPMLRNEFNKPVFTIFLLFGNLYFLHQISNLMLILFIMTVVFVNLVCPILFIRYQRYKENIYGPWDEAIVDDADSILFKN